MTRTDDAAHDPGRSQYAGQRPGVDTGNRDHPVVRQVIAEGPVGAPVAGHGRRVAHDKAGHLGSPRLGILRRHAVVADLRRRHGDDLSGVGRIGQDLLIAGHARVEHDLTASDATGASRGPAIPGSVFESENCDHQGAGASEAVTRLCVSEATCTVVAHLR